MTGMIGAAARIVGAYRTTPLSRAFGSRLGKIAGGFLVLLVLVAIFAPWIAPFDYAAQDLTNGNAPPGWPHLLGTDQFGRDVLSRIIHGARTSLSVSATAIAISICAGMTLGIVGESGSGKSLTAMSVMGLLPLSGGRITAGSILFDGQELTSLPEAAYRRLRGGRLGLITQNPMTSLDPLQTIGPQVDAVAILHLGMTAAAARARTVEILGTLRIPEPALICNRYPHQMSGGMKQRIVIAMALAADPDVLVADELTTALDVTVQAQIIRLLDDLVKQRDLALILITHDMSVVAQTCDRVVVMYAGRAVEQGPVGAIFAAPQHPYTQALIGCIPRGLGSGERLTGIPGTVPTVLNYPAGCPFHPRCPRAQGRCTSERPVLTPHAGGTAACHFAGAAP